MFFKISFYSCRLIVAALLILQLSCSNQPRKQLEESFTLDIDRKVVEGLDALKVVQGLSVAIYTPDGIYTHGYGVANIDTGELVSKDTAFYIASSTKPITALAMSILHHRGEINLDATLEEFSPDAIFLSEVKSNQITLRDLLSQASGIINNPIQIRLAFTGKHTPELLWELLIHTKPNTKFPLGNFRYSNYNYNIVTILTDRELGKSWKDILADEVFSKIGMEHSTAYMSRAREEGWPVAHPHDTLGSNTPRLVATEKLKTDATMQSAGGVVMNAVDAAKWLEILIEKGKVGNQQIFPAKVIAEIVKPHVKVKAKKLWGGHYHRDHYGLGWYIGRYRGDKLVHHFGGFAGARAHVSFMPDRKIGVAVFVNDSGVGSPFVDDIANYIYDSLTSKDDAEKNYHQSLQQLIDWKSKKEKRMVANAAKLASRASTLSLPLEDYAGSYVNSFGELIKISIRGDNLSFVDGSMITVTMPYKEPESIRFNHISGLPMTVRFRLTNDGEVDRFILLDEIYRKQPAG